MHDSVAVCADETIVTLGGTVHVKPAEPDAESMTVPVNPLMGVTVIVEVPDAPARIWAGVTGLAVTAKSCGGVTVTVTVAE